MKIETWKDLDFIKSGKYDYQVSSEGRVRRIWTIENNGAYVVYNELLNIHKNEYGYSIVTIESRNYKLHRLVAKAHIPNPENKPIVNHINENINDNRACNLSWCTIKENNNYGTARARKSLRREINKGTIIVLHDSKTLEIIDIFQCSREAEAKTGINRRTIDNLLSKNILKPWRGIIFNRV